MRTIVLNGKGLRSILEKEYDLKIDHLYLENPGEQLIIKIEGTPNEENLSDIEVFLFEGGPKICDCKGEVTPHYEIPSFKDMIKGAGLIKYINDNGDYKSLDNPIKVEDGGIYLTENQWNIIKDDALKLLNAEDKLTIRPKDVAQEGINAIMNHFKNSKYVKGDDIQKMTEALINLRQMVPENYQ